MAPFIANSKGFRVHSILHSETQRGKGPADGHFAVAINLDTEFLNEKGLNVTTLADVVVALNHSKGIANTTADLIDIDRNFWKHLRMKQSVSTKQIGVLGR